MLPYVCYINKNIKHVASYFATLGIDTPTPKDLYKHVTPYYAARWEDIGICLGIELPQLEIIKKNNPNDVSDCCKDLWKKWLSANPDATWEKLFTAIDTAVLSTSGSTGIYVCKL